MSRSRLLPLLLAVLPLLIGCLGGGDGGLERAAGNVDNLLGLGEEPDTVADSFPGRLPDDFPAELPQYPDAEVILSRRVVSEADLLYLIVYDSTDSAAEVVRYYDEALEEDPWQVEASASSERLTTVQFSKVDDADISGAVAVNQSQAAGDRTTIFVTIQVIAGAGEEEGPPFQLGASRPLPSNFPSAVPIYPGSTVIGTAFLRSPGTEDFLITFLTPDTQDDVVDYYRQEFEELGWTVEDESAQGLADAISFSDSLSPEISGFISADRFAGDPDFTEVDMQLQVRPGRGRDN